MKNILAGNKISHILNRTLTVMLMIFTVLFFNTDYAKADTEGTIYNYGYNGGIQKFVAPENGYYELEVWGAQGGTGGSYRGGFGGYSKGVVKLAKDETLFVVVGGQGSSSTSSGRKRINGGYNGGGYGYQWDSSSLRASGGGGATHIATVSGLLSSLSSYKGTYSSTTGTYDSKDILIVAGGGSGGYGYSGRWWVGSGGGGYIGGYTYNSGTPGKQNAGYSFGQAADTSSVVYNNGSNHSGGGGGFYGGYSYWGEVGAGGGSGFIGSSRLISYGPITKSMYCYSCSATTSAQIYTVNTSAYSGSALTNTTKTGSGYAKITLVEILDEDSRLSELSIDKGNMSPSFDSDTYSYNASFLIDESNINISAQTISETSQINDTIGNYDVPAGVSEYTICVTSEFGNVSTYTINMYREPSSYVYLNGIKLDDTLLTEFSNSNLNYNITVPYDKETINIEALYGRTSQTIHGAGEKNLSAGNNEFKITVISEDQNSTLTYTLNIYREHSSKLKSLDIDGYDVEPTFNPETLEYEINILPSIMSLNVSATAYDNSANISYKGFGYIKNNSVGTIKVISEGCETTTYTIKILKNGSYNNYLYYYDYTGGEQEFVAPFDGYYQLETWGAQGGTAGSYRGGYGGYSTGAIYLKKGEKLYIVVGGQGSSTSYGSGKRAAGGYNGGGYGYQRDSSLLAAGGGGATHISKTPGMLSSLSDDRNSVLIVSGGGAGGYGYGSRWWVGNSAGGYYGGYSYRSDFAGTQTSGYAFGQATDTLNYIYNNGTNHSGGGGGFYGGYSAWGENGAGGGSSYIGNSRLISYGDVTKSMYCYGCKSNNSTNLYTVSTNRASATATSYYPKSLNGYAKITMLPQPSENNFLSSLTIESEDNIKSYTPNFNIETEDYYVTLDTEETQISIKAKPEDSLSTIEGLGNFYVPSGTTIFEITVTAESGAVRKYKLHVTREANTNEYPTDIIINGLVPSLCSINEEYCIINPTFDKLNGQYELTVPSRIKQLYFNVEKAHYYQTVSGEGKVTLNGGENLFTIAVTSEDGVKTSVYKYYVTRDMTGNTDLSILEILDPIRDINYDPDITEYYLSVPNEYTKIEELEIETDDPNASYIVSGNENFEIGMNQVTITVTAANGEIKNYILNVYREKSGNTYLSSLSVSNGNVIYDMIPTFDKVNIGYYKVTVPNEISSVTVNATSEVTSTEVSGTGLKTLNSGENEALIATTAEDGSIEIYKLIIIRQKNSNTNLSSLNVSDGQNLYNLQPDFNKDILEYNIDLNEGVSEINISAIPEISTTTYKLLDNKNIQLGQNIKRVMAIAEDGSTKIYTLTLIRPVNSNNYLSDLIVKESGQTYDINFDKNTTEYELDVENSVKSLNVTGIKDSIYSKVNGNGNYALSVGDNFIYISVTSEDNNVKDYMIKVARKPNSNADLTNITTDKGTIVPSFDKDTLGYSINVENNVDSIVINATNAESTTSITGIGTYSLNSGHNTIELVTMAEDQTTSKTYTLDVYKDKSDNDNLSYLLMEEGAISPKFDANIISYTASVPYEVNEGTFHIELEDNKATYQIINNSFEVGSNTVIVRVTSESGETKDYSIIVTREEESDNYIKNIILNAGTLSPNYTKKHLYYEVNVDYSVKAINVDATLENSLHTLIGNGNYNLNTGRNLVVLSVTDINGKKRDYQIVINRKQNSEARINSISLDGSILNPTFDKDVYEYTAATSNSKLIFDKIELVDDNASYVVENNEFTDVGNYEVKIKVTAADNLTTKEYIINVEKEPSNNNNLKLLNIEGYSINPTFNPASTLYSITVGNDVNSLLVNAVAEDEKATITGSGINSLNVGENQIVIEVTSESGNVKAYTIIVTKEGSNNNFISSLSINNGTINGDFVKDKLEYDVTVPYQETKLDMTILLENENAAYSVSNNDLSVGSNVVYINVLAENGDLKTYKLNVTRQEAISSMLENLIVNNYEITPSFNSYIAEYDVLVDNEITSLNIEPISVDKQAKIEIIGNENFIVGKNVVEIIVTSRDESSTQTYTLNVERQVTSNTYLDYFYTNEGDVSPRFDKNILSYSIDVSKETTNIEFYGEAIDKSATIIGMGSHELTPGENKIPIKVTTKSGISRTYYVTVNRAKDTNNYLESLVLKAGSTVYDLNPTFNKEHNSYSVTVPIGTQVVNLIGTYSDTALVTGLGLFNINPGDNEISVNVTAEDGSVRVYTITVTREKSSNNNLIELTSSSGELIPDFSYEETEYAINLDSSASLLSFEAIAEDNGAIITGTESKVVPDGTSTRIINVTAEDGSVRTYTINITKDRTDNALLSSLSVNGYTFDKQFDPNVFEYHISVPNNKKILFANEVNIQTSDRNATVSRTKDLNILTTTQNEYIVKVTAKDGFTTNTYKIIVEREKSNLSTLKSLNVNVGYISSSFNPNVYNYVWVVPKSQKDLTSESVTAVANDLNATIINTDSVDATSSDAQYIVKVISEDGTSSTEYNLSLEIDLSSDASLYSLNIDKGYYSPTFNSDVHIYDAYVYENETELNVSAMVNNYNSSITSGTGKIELNDVDTENPIVITAEDGTIETYTLNIHKTIKIDKYLNNINLNGLDDLNCNNGKCILSPLFSKEISSYSIRVPYEYTSLNIAVEKMNNQQQVKYKIGEEYITSYLLPMGKTNVTVEVYDGLNNKTMEYVLSIERCKSSNAYLKTLSVNGYTLNQTFNKNVLEYSIEVPNDVNEVTINAVQEFSDSLITLNGYNYLQEGNNDATITVIAPDCTTKTYIIHILKNQQYNSYLKNITVSTGVFWDLSPKFNKTTYSYTTMIPNIYNKIAVEAVPVSSDTIVTGTGEYTFDKGFMVVTLTSTAVDGSISVYKINVAKQSNANTNLKSLTVAEGSISPTFDKTNNFYDVSVGEHVDSLTINATPEDSTSSISITGNKQLIGGENLVSIIVMSADKSASRIYQLLVHKASSTNNFLSELKVTDKNNNSLLNTSFNKNVNTYNLNVTEDIEQVNIEAIAEKKSSIIIGNGELNLDYGNNYKEITVFSESGDINIYQLNIYRNYNLNLQNIVSDIGEITPEFNSSITDYTLVVPNNETNITFVAQRESDKVRVVGSGTYELSTGNNTINFIVTAPDNRTKQYNVIVKREYSDNNYIDDLFVSEGKLDKEFDKDINEYTINVRNSINKVDLHITLEDETASYTVLNNNFNGEGSYPVIVRVLAENGDTRDYTINVNVQKDSFFSNRLLNLTLSEGILTPDFNSDINYYAATVANSINSVEINAVKESVDAKVVGLGTHELELGKNLIQLDVTSKDDVINTYTVVIYRTENSDATLSNLTIRNHEFNPIFDKNVTSYNLSIDSTINELDIIATPTDPNSNVQITGNNNLITGENTVTINVTAPDGITTKSYVLNVTKQISQNNYLSNLSVQGYELNPAFTKFNYGPYILNVEDNVSNVIIDATAEVESTTITGLGSINLNNGQNLIRVFATSESGLVRAYTIIVNKSKNSDSTLKDIILSDGILTPNFDSNILQYTVNVSDNVEKINITGLPNASTSEVTGNGQYDIINSETEIPLTVKSQNGSQSIYKLTVIKENALSSKILSLNVKEGELSPTFNKNILNYNLIVPYEITSLDMSVELEDENASYVINSNSEFVIGNNVVQIIVDSKDNVSQTIYTINVNRQKMASNYLSELDIGYTLTPAFDKNNLYYESDVPSNVNNIQITASAEDSSSTITGTGLKELNYGLNKFYVNVESMSGNVRTYTIVVNKKLDDDNYLLSLSSSIGDITPSFDKEINNYTLTVPAKTTQLELSGLASANSTVVGLGITNILVGNQERNIVVTNKNGETNVYKISINRIASNNTKLVSLIPISGNLNYNNDTNDYTMEVDDNVSVMSFDYELEDQDATITGNEITNINYGENIINIAVTAEDGVTTRTIKINVIRNKEITSIVPNKRNVLLTENAQETVTYELNPIDTTYADVEWISNDPTIATVDSNGLITAIKDGYTTIDIVSKHNSNIKSTINVTVIKTEITSSIYNIYRDGDVKYTIGAEPKTKISDYIVNFDNNQSILYVYDSDDQLITDFNKNIGTNMRIKLIIDETTYDNLIVAVRGDLTGEGLITVADQTIIKNIILGKEKPIFIIQKVADINGDGKITVADLTDIKNYILGKLKRLN